MGAGRVEEEEEEVGMGRRDPFVPQFPDTSPATCVQAFVDDAFGYSRPGGEVGGPLPLPVQVCVRVRFLPAYVLSTSLGPTLPRRGRSPRSVA